MAAAASHAAAIAIAGLLVGDILMTKMGPAPRNSPDQQEVS